MLSASAQSPTSDFKMAALVANPRGKSPIWQYFALRKDNNGLLVQNEAVCRTCDAVVKNAGGGTSNLTSHMRRHHPGLNIKQKPGAEKGNQKGVLAEKQVVAHEAENDQKQTFTNKQYTINNMFRASTKYNPKSAKSKAITMKVARFIVKDLRPYRIVESKEFKDVIKVLDPQYTLPSRKQFAEVVVPQLYNETKAEVKANLGTACQVALTSDGWTSRSTESYITITSTFIDESWELVNYVLQTRPLPESHTAENIADVIQNAVTEWKLPTAYGEPPLVSDNASNMTKAARIFGGTHVGCLAHTLNLAAQKALKLKNVAHAVARLRNVVSFFHRSALASAILKTKAQLLALPNHKLKTDVCTRWNSAYDMIVRFLELQPAIVATLRATELSKVKVKEMSLSDENLSLAEDIAATLKPLKDITVMLCSESSPTVSIIMPLHHRLTSSLFKSEENDSVTVKEMKQAMCSDLLDRYADKAEFLNVATAIDPRFKHLSHLSDQGKYEVYTRLTEEAIKVATISRSKVVVKTEKPDEADQLGKVNTSDPPLPALPTLPDSGDSPVKQEIEIVEPPSLESGASKGDTVLHELLGDVYVTHVEPAKSVQELVQSEVLQYKAEPSLSLQENPLAWWKNNEIKFPYLSKLAKALLCIPATSVPSERVFSTAGDILTAQRASLKPKHVDMLLFLKKNLQ